MLTLIKQKVTQISIVLWTLDKAAALRNAE